MELYLRRLTDIMLFAAITLFPAYLWESGSMQVSHYFFLFFAGLVFYRRKALQFDTFDIVLLFFVLYCWTREVLAVLHEASYATLLPAAHFTYSLIIFKAARLYADDAQKQKILSAGLITSLLIVLGAVLFEGTSLVYDGKMPRSTGTFNNPNQLGYYSILTVSLGLFLYINRIVSWWLFLLVAAGSFFISIVSLSKAAIISMSVVVMFVVVELFRRFLALEPKQKVLLAVSISAIAIPSSFAVSANMQHRFSDLMVYKRLSMMYTDENDSTLSSRGYDILPQSSINEMLFGISTEGVKMRNGNEIHSTFVSALTNYGFAGGSLFVLFFCLLAWDAVSHYGIWNTVCLLLPATLYGITHNGSRSTLFWVLLSLVSISQTDEKMNEYDTDRSRGNEITKIRLS